MVSSRIRQVLVTGRQLSSSITVGWEVTIFAWKAGAVVPGLDCSAMGRRADKTGLTTNLAPPAKLIDTIVSLV